VLKIGDAPTNAEKNPIKADEIASRQLHALRQYQRPRARIMGDDPSPPDQARGRAEVRLFRSPLHEPDPLVQRETLALCGVRVEQQGQPSVCLRINHPSGSSLLWGGPCSRAAMAADAMAIRVAALIQASGSVVSVSIIRISDPPGRSCSRPLRAFAIAADNLADFLFPSRSLAWDYRCVAAITVRRVLPSTSAWASAWQCVCRPGEIG
jgi:hypothetical protein